MIKNSVEKKLKELGYERQGYDDYIYSKTHYSYAKISIIFSSLFGEKLDESKSCVSLDNLEINTEEEVDDIKEAVKKLKSDLAIIKEMMKDDK